MRQGLWRGRGRRKEEISQWGESGGCERGPSFCSLLVLPPAPATLLPTSPFPELTTVSETRHTYRRSCHRRQAPRWAVCVWGLGAGGAPHVGGQARTVRAPRDPAHALLAPLAPDKSDVIFLPRGWHTQCANSEAAPPRGPGERRLDAGLPASRGGRVYRPRTRPRAAPRQLGCCRKRVVGKSGLGGCQDGSRSRTTCGLVPRRRDRRWRKKDSRRLAAVGRSPPPSLTAFQQLETRAAC